MHLSKRTMSALTVVGTGACAAFLLYLMSQGCLSDPQRLQNLLSRSGFFAPLLFLGLQVFQTVIPVIPGGVTSAIGVICFGSIWGFIYNYIGLVLGSYIAFWMVRKYGKPFLESVTSKETYDKYIHWLDKGKKFEWFFAFAIFVPGFPDDILCMIAALTKMSNTKFMLILLACKPFGLFLYSQGLTMGIQGLANWLG